MNPLRDDAFNQQLACACQATRAACCRKGLLFLPLPEYHRIRHWLARNEPAGLAEFEARCQPHEGFFLYDQKDSCQFLDGRALCRLHEAGVKPSECFWWPFHVYCAADGRLEIRLSTSCCQGHQYFQPGLPFVALVEAQARDLGGAVIREFRRHYAGSYDTILVKQIQD